MFAINIESLKTLTYHIFKKKHQVFIQFEVSVVINIMKIFEEEESIEISKILGLITNIKEFRKYIMMSEENIKNLDSKIQMKQEIISLKK